MRALPRDYAHISFFLYATMAKYISVAVEGTIGCGKTTLLKQLALLDSSINVLCEPIEAFCNYKQHKPLSLAYSEPKKYTCATQLHIIRELDTYYSSHLSPGCVNVTERCLASAEPFINAHTKMGYLSEFEKSLLTDVAREAGQPYYVKKYFFIECPPAITLQRIVRRARVEERLVDPSFIYELNECYQQYIKHIVSVRGDHCVHVAAHDSLDLPRTLLTFLNG